MDLERFGPRRAIVVAVLAATIATAAGGCSSSSDSSSKATTTTSPAAVVTDPSGSPIPTPPTAELPKGWPKALALPKGVSLVTSSTTSVDGVPTMALVAQATGSVKDFLPGVKKRVVAAGFKVTKNTSTTESFGAYGGFTAVKGKTTVMVAMSNTVTDDTKVTITISVATRR